MLFEARLKLLLANDPGVSALVGNRIYPRLPATPTLPAIRYTTINGGGYEYTHDGVSGRSVHVQLDTWANTYGEANELGDATKAAINARTWLGVCKIINDQDDYEEDTGFYRRIIDAQIELEEV